MLKPLMEEAYKDPIYTIGIVAKSLKVCPATLRIWEHKGLIKPKRLGKNRYYSRFDMDRLAYIKDLIQKKRINIEGVRNILLTTRCWELKKCRPREREVCPVYLKYGQT